MHLCFGDDLLMFTRGDVKSVQLLSQRFHMVSTTSSLKASLSKSQVYFGGVSHTTREDILQVLGIKQGELHLNI